MNYTTLNELKAHLNIETGYTTDDIYLTTLLDVAESACNEYTNNGLEIFNTYDLPIQIKHAIILLAGHWYLNRNMVSFGQGYEIPYTFQFLLNPYKNYIIS